MSKYDYTGVKYKNVEKTKYNNETFCIGDTVYGYLVYEKSGYPDVYKPFKAVVKEITKATSPGYALYPCTYITFTITEKENGGKIHSMYEHESGNCKSFRFYPENKHQSMKYGVYLSHDLDKIKSDCMEELLYESNKLKKEKERISMLEEFLENANSTLQNVTF